MTAQRAAILLAGAAALGAFAIPASAQVSDDIVLEIMRQCARIDDATARLACYDNNIRAAGGNPRNSVPGEMVSPGGSSAPLSNSGPSGFGREDVRTPARFETPAGQMSEITARVRRVRERQPGIYLIELEDGAQWLFTDSVSRSYSPPRQGSEVEISRAALGSFLLRFDNQASVRVERIR